MVWILPCQILLVKFVGQEVCWACVGFRRLTNLTDWNGCKFIVIVISWTSRGIPLLPLSLPMALALIASSPIVPLFLLLANIMPYFASLQCMLACCCSCCAQHFCLLQ